MAAESSTDVVKLQPSTSCSSSPSAYIEMPDENTVMMAKVMRVEGARLFVEAQLQVFGHGARAAAVVERHHEHAHEQHRGNRADPVEVRRHDAVLGAGSRHADQFLRAEVGREEGQAGDPDGHRPAGE